MIDAESKAAKAAKRKAEMQAASSRGLDALLAQLEKKKKLNILDKTRKVSVRVGMGRMCYGHVTMDVSLAALSQDKSHAVRLVGVWSKKLPG